MVSPQSKAFLDDLEKHFLLTLPEAREMISRFHREMRLGLSGKPDRLQMLPAFAGRPNGAESGRFLALDLGGTHFRVMEIILDGCRKASINRAMHLPIPPEAMHTDADSLFGFLADGVIRFFQEYRIHRGQKIDLAFCFSFPVQQDSIRSGKLIRWTKDFSASGVVGHDVVALLSKAIRKWNLSGIDVCVLVNDTVGTLAAGAYSEPSCDMGLILGTGTNACYLERGDRLIVPHPDSMGDKMIINVEWGDFEPPNPTPYDSRVDRESGNPGGQKLEKAVSGKYLGKIAQSVIREMIRQGLLRLRTSSEPTGEDSSLSTRHLSILEGGFGTLPGFISAYSSEDRVVLQHIARIVSTRSATIAAAATAAVVTWMDPKLKVDHFVAVDGSLFEKYPNYKERMEAFLRLLFPNHANRIRLGKVRDGSGIGAAVIAAMQRTHCV